MVAVTFVAVLVVEGVGAQVVLGRGWRVQTTVRMRADGVAPRTRSHPNTPPSQTGCPMAAARRTTSSPPRARAHRAAVTDPPPTRAVPETNVGAHMDSESAVVVAIGASPAVARLRWHNRQTCPNSAANRAPQVSSGRPQTTTPQVDTAAGRTALRGC